VLVQLQTLARNGDASAEENLAAFNIIVQRYQRRHAIGLTSDYPKPSIISSSLASALPISPSLAQNYPNPFNPTTIIRFHLNARQKVRLLIFDLTGKLMRTLHDGELSAGEQTILWDGRHQNGKDMASGVYFYELAVGNKVERRRMTLIR